MNRPDTSLTEVAILYRTAPDIDPQGLASDLANAPDANLCHLKLAKVSGKATVLSDGQTIIAIELFASPRPACKFGGIGASHTELTGGKSAFQIIQDHGAYLQVRAAPVNPATPQDCPQMRLDRLRICAKLCQHLTQYNEPLAIHWEQSRQILSPGQFIQLTDSLALYSDIRVRREPDQTDGQKQSSFQVAGAEFLLGVPVEISTCPFEAEELRTPLDDFIKACVKHRRLPANNTKFTSKTGMEFTVTRTSAEHDDTETLTLTPTVKPAKVNVERRRSEGQTQQNLQPKTDAESRPRRRTVRQDERDLRHAYRGQETPQARKLAVGDVPANIPSRPLARFAGSLAFIAVLGVSGALGAGLVIYGAEGFGERAQILWDKTGLND